MLTLISIGAQIRPSPARITLTTNVHLSSQVDSTGAHLQPVHSPPMVVSAFPALLAATVSIVVHSRDSAREAPPVDSRYVLSFVLLNFHGRALILFM
jgi:hypothetical protein